MIDDKGILSDEAINELAEVTNRKLQAQMRDILDAWINQWVTFVGNSSKPLPDGGWKMAGQLLSIILPILSARHRKELQEAVEQARIEERKAMPVTDESSDYRRQVNEGDW